MPPVTITPIDLLILGLLQDRPMHGYELHQQVKTERVDAWFSLSMAGIYYSLAKLRDRGLITQSRQHRSAGADKTIYYVTDAGRDVFFSSMESQVAGEMETSFAYDLGIYLLNRLPLEKALDLLERRRAFLTQWAERVRARRFGNDASLPAQARAILDHTARFIEMERGWLEEIIHDILAASAAESKQPRAGLMTLAGDLGQYHLPDLIRLIEAGKHTGALTVLLDQQTVGIVFEVGVLRCLLYYGSDDSHPDISTVTERVLDLFREEVGQFRFEHSRALHACVLPAAMTGTELILKGCRRADRWEIIRRLVPSADTVYELAIPAEELAGLHLSPQEAEVARSVNGAHSLADIAQIRGITIFDVSRAIYCLAAIGALRVADAERIRVRRLFREIAELMCRSTLSWRRSPEDRTCESEVNVCCASLPLRIVEGRIADQSDPQLKTAELVRLYTEFLKAQYQVVSSRFGREKARAAYHRTIQQLAPELQEVARHWNFDRLAEG